MKYIKNFKRYNESIGLTDNIDQDEAQFNHDNNPVLKLKVKQYVESTLRSNNSLVILKMLGLKEEDMTDDNIDEIEKKAIEYFVKNPHKMPTVDEFENDNVAFNQQTTDDNLSDDRSIVPLTSNIGQQ